MSASAGAAPGAFRSGSGTWVSVSLMVSSSSPSGSTLLAGRHVAPDEFVDLCFNGGALQHDAAVGPLDPAIAGRDFRFGEYHQAALEAALRRMPLDLLARGLVEGRVDPHHQMRRRYQLGEAIADEAGDLAKRLG